MVLPAVRALLGTSSILSYEWPEGNCTAHVSVGKSIWHVPDGGAVKGVVPMVPF